MDTISGPLVGTVSSARDAHRFADSDTSGGDDPEPVGSQSVYDFVGDSAQIAPGDLGGQASDKRLEW